MSRQLRIALIAPIAMPVLAGAGDSIEQLLWLLAEGLVDRGHDITLFATGDSQTSARLSARYTRGYEQDEDLWDWRMHESLNAAAAFERRHEFDLIHSHAYHHALPFTRLVAPPVVHTYHVELDPDVIDAFRRYPEAHVVAVSAWQRSTLHGLRDVTVIHHGIDTAAFEPGDGADGHLLFLGRLIADKGPREAIEIARAANRPLILAGAADADYERELAPLVDGELIRHVGPVNARRRNELLGGAVALLLPLRYPEPFGLVMIEAMACGTPVLATGIGAVPEVVEPGLTGYHAPEPAELGRLLEATERLDRHRVRARAVERFDAARMVAEHERLYLRLLGSAGQT